MLKCRTVGLEVHTSAWMHMTHIRELPLEE